MKFKKILCIFCLACLASGCSTVGPKRENPSDVIVTEQVELENTQPKKESDADNSANDSQANNPDNSPINDSPTSSTSDNSQTEDSGSRTGNDSQQEAEPVFEDTGFYESCTSYPSEQVESFAQNIKSLILDKDWNALSELISYPITIDGSTYESRSDFLAVDFDSRLNPSFLSAIEAESCQEMFHNWQGISMGKESQLWFSEVYSDESNSSLLITGINNFLP